MAIENITFDAATQQGLNATNELAKIGQTIQNTGSFIQNEFETQEINETIKLYREESEKHFRQSNYNQKAFDELNKPLVDKILKGASNQRVLRKIQGEIDYKTNEYSGAIWGEQQKVIKQKAVINTIETSEGNLKEYQKAINAGDYNRARQIYNDNITSISGNSLLDDGKRFELTENFKNNKFNVDKENLQNKITTSVESQLNYNNYSADQLKNTDIEKDIKNTDINGVLKELNIKYINGSYITEDGNVLNDTDMEDIKKSAYKTVATNFRKREIELQERASNFNKQMVAFNDIVVNGNPTDAQFAIVRNEAIQTGDSENVKNVDFMRETHKLITQNTDLNSVMEYTAKKYPNDFVRQNYAANMFIQKRNAEVSQTADFWVNNGKIKDPITLDGGSADVIDQISRRLDNVKNLSNERFISDANSKALTTQENASMASYIGSLSPVEVPEFLNGMIEKVGFYNTNKIMSELNKSNGKVMGKILPIVNVTLDNYNPNNKSSLNEVNVYAAQGSGVDKSLIGKPYNTALDIAIQDYASGVTFGSAKEKQDKIKVLKDAMIGHDFSKGVNLLEENAMIDETKLAEVAEKVFGKKSTYNNNSFFVPEKDAEVVNSNIEKFENGEISKDFLQYNGQNSKIDYWLDGLERGNATIRTEKDTDKDGNYVTKYYVVDNQGNIMADNNGNKLNIPLDKKQSDIETESVSKLITMKKNNSKELEAYSPRIQSSLNFLVNEMTVAKTGEKFSIIQRAGLKEDDPKYSERINEMYKEHIQIMIEERRKLSKEFNQKYEWGDLLKAHWSKSTDAVVEEGKKVTVDKGIDIAIPLLKIINMIEGK